MSTIRSHAAQLISEASATPIAQEAVVTDGTARRALGALRIVLGLTFLWAFLDKLLGLGFSTGAITDATGAKTGIDLGKDAWIHGGNPTLGFLKFGADGPLEGFYHSIAGQGWVNVLFMLGLLAIGVTLTSGVAIRLGTAAGTLMYLLMWTVALPPANNPVLDDHILGAAAMVVVGLTLAGDTWGLGKMWSMTSVVRRHPVLR